MNPNINNKYTIAFANEYPHPTLDDDVAIENLYTPDQNPVNVDTSFTNIDIIIAGNVINDEAKITGITPAIASFKGICVPWAPTIFLPTTFFEYCTGTLLSASCTNTTPATNNNAPIIIPNAVINPVVLNPVLVNIIFQIVVIPDGRPEIIPIKIIIDIPFPIPLLVICSPNHISKDVPATNDDTTSIPVNHPAFINTPEDLYPK